MTEVIHTPANGARPALDRPRRGEIVSWSNHEEKKLRLLYPSSAKDEICEEIPQHTWASIRRRAAYLKIGRLESMPRNENLHPVVNALIDRRVALGLRPAQAAKLCGWSPKWFGALERGTRLPSLPMLDAWAAALNVELTLGPARHCAAESATNQE